MMKQNNTDQAGGRPDEPSVSQAEYDAWFCTKVQRAMKDKRHGIPNDVVEAHFSKLRAEAARKADEHG